MCLADDEKVDEAVYKLIFHISERVLAPTISDMRGSTVVYTVDHHVVMVHTISLKDWILTTCSF